jgi:hypothetical protein
MKVGYNMNPILWDTHSYVFRALSLTKGNPRGHILKSPYRTDTAENESHETTDETTVSPAGGLEGGPEVATQTAFARLAVVQEKTVGAAHPIVMEVVNERNFEIKSSLIYGWGEAREGILNHPQIKTAFLLQMPKLFCDSTAVKCTNRKHELAAE